MRRGTQKQEAELVEKLAEVRATTKRLCEAIGPYRKEQEHMAELLERLRVALSEDDGQ